MTTKIVEGVEYISEEIPGKGVCLVPKHKLITEKDLIPGARFVDKNGYVSFTLMRKNSERGGFRWFLGGNSDNDFCLWDDGFPEGKSTQDMVNYLNGAFKAKKVEAKK